MNKRKLDIAVAEATRFLHAAKELQSSVTKEIYDDQKIEIVPRGRLSAYVKRASMDLTHVLADMRKSS